MNPTRKLSSNLFLICNTCPWDEFWYTNEKTFVPMAFAGTGHRYNTKVLCLCSLLDRKGYRRWKRTRILEYLKIPIKSLLISFPWNFNFREYMKEGEHGGRVLFYQWKSSVCYCKWRVLSWDAIEHHNG